MSNLQDNKRSRNDNSITSPWVFGPRDISYFLSQQSHGCSISSFPNKKEIDNYIFNKKLDELSSIIRKEICEKIKLGTGNCIFNLDSTYYTSNVIKKAKEILTEKGYKVIEHSNNPTWELEIY